MTTNATIRNNSGSKNDIMINIRSNDGIQQIPLGPGNEIEITVHDAQDVRISEREIGHVNINLNKSNVVSVGEQVVAAVGGIDAVSLSEEAEAALSGDAVVGLSGLGADGELIQTDGPVDLSTR
jgi:hypothetical protein